MVDKFVCIDDELKKELASLSTEFSWIEFIKENEPKGHRSSMNMIPICAE